MPIAELRSNQSGKPHPPQIGTVVTVRHESTPFRAPLKCSTTRALRCNFMLDVVRSIMYRSVMYWIRMIEILCPKSPSPIIGKIFRIFLPRKPQFFAFTLGVDDLQMPQFMKEDIIQ